MRIRFREKEQTQVSPAGNTNIILLLTGLILSVVFYACNSSSGTSLPAQAMPQALPVITLSNQLATTYQEFSASLEGTKDIEIRPQVDGYIDKIFADEGAQVKKVKLYS
jgi:membrane fusion protein (multidrug efflux system)